MKYAALLLLIACADDNFCDSHPEHSICGGPPDEVVTEPPPRPMPRTLPSSAELCTLRYDEATPEDAVALLGNPSSISSSGSSTDLFYRYDGGRVLLYLAFEDGVLHYTSLDNALYPECWRKMAADR